MTDSLRDRLYAAVRDQAAAGVGASFTPAAVALLADILRVPPTDGHELANEIIRKHGIDRYPHPNDQALKLAAEVGELADEVLKRAAEGNLDKVRKEYGDAGLALYELGSKLGIDLLSCMQQVIADETRDFSIQRPVRAVVTP
jgi:NTP pyrophosphatase (non-canonical NTP hydrolase)